MATGVNRHFWGGWRSLARRETRKTVSVGAPLGWVAAGGRMLEGRKTKMPVAHVCVFSSSEKQEEAGAEDNMCPHQAARCQHNVSAV